MTENDLKKDLDYLSKQVPIVYKYMNIETALCFIKNFQLSFKSPSIFNDPYDCYDGLIKFGKVNSINRKSLINHTFSNLNRSARRNKLKKLKKIIKDKEICDKYKELLPIELQKNGITCFSEIPNNLLMWSHYAESHKGICVGFKLQDIFLTFQKDTNYKVAVLKVKYTEDLKPVDYFNNQNLSILNCLRTKSINWEYEKEVRLILSQIQFDETKRKYFPIDKNSIAIIYFGSRINSDILKSISQECKKNLSDIKFYKMELQNDSFKLKPKPFTL